MRWIETHASLSDWSDLGVHVIWYEQHSEVPAMIRRIIAPIKMY